MAVRNPVRTACALLDADVPRLQAENDALRIQLQLAQDAHNDTIRLVNERLDELTKGCEVTV